MQANTCIVCGRAIQLEALSVRHNAFPVDISVRSNSMGLFRCRHCKTVFALTRAEYQALVTPKPKTAAATAELDLAMLY